MICRNITWLLVIAVLLGDAGNVLAQAENAGSVAVRVPESIGPFRMIERRDFPDKASGVMLRYQRPDSLFADLFLYPGPGFDKNCDLACAQSVLKQEGDDFIATFPEFIRRKYVDTIAVASDSALRPDANAKWRIGRHLRFTQRKAGVAQWSELYAFYLPDVRVKVRATYAVDTGRARAIAEFAASAVPALTSGPDTTKMAGASAPPEIPAVVVSTTLGGTPTTVFPMVAQLMASKGWTVADSSSASGRFVSAPRHEWPAGTEKEPWHKGEAPDVRLLVRLEPKGDSTVVTVGADVPTGEKFPDAKLAQAVQLMTIVQFASELKPDPKKKGKKKS